jgi:hypothetical protein
MTCSGTSRRLARDVVMSAVMSGASRRTRSVVFFVDGISIRSMPCPSALFPREPNTTRTSSPLRSPSRGIRINVLRPTVN